MRTTLKIALAFLLCVFGSNLLYAQDSLNLDTSSGVFKNDSFQSHIVEINRLIQTAQCHLGTPYRYAGKTPGGFDCSGFVFFCYSSSLGIKTPASSSYYTNYGLPVSKDSARPGDVICFQGYKNRGNVPGHVGIITEVTPTEIYFIHAASHGGIRYDQLSQEYYANRFMFIRRVLK
jgi:cell wall-associated NlpC family hydrolase